MKSKIRNKVSRNKVSLDIDKNAMHRNEKGIVFVSALALLAVLTLAGTVAVNSTTTDIKISSNYKTSKQAFYAAEAGAETAFSDLRNLLDTNLKLTPAQLNSIVPHTMSGYDYSHYPVTRDTQTQLPITQGNFVGLVSFIQKYSITSEASLTGDNPAKAQVTLFADDNLIPLFQFAVFYENDLEILPGSSMTFTGGRIHSNSDIYLGTNNTLSIESEITSAGNIFNYRKDDGITMPGAVQFIDGSGNPQAMAGLDSDSPDWVTEAINRWDGNVKSHDHGIFNLNLPLPESGTAIDIIKPDPDGKLLSGNSSDPPELLEGRYYWKAGLRIIDRVAFDKDGNSVDLTDGGTKPNPLSNQTFYDQREKKNITVTTVDVDLLQSSTNVTTALNNPPGPGDPGILYINETGSNKGIRLINGSTLDSGFTIASENPVYVKGDYNVDNKPSSIVADAVTILSNNWDDANSVNSSQDLDERIASDTTVNTVIMTGQVETDGSQYSGGLENFPRFLEKWTNKTFTYSGSLLSLWQSEQATGDWHYGDFVYTAPARNWTFNIDSTNLPPGTPRVRFVQKVGWAQNLD